MLLNLPDIYICYVTVNKINEQVSFVFLQVSKTGVSWVKSLNEETRDGFVATDWHDAADLCRVLPGHHPLLHNQLDRQRAEPTAGSYLGPVRCLAPLLPQPGHIHRDGPQLPEGLQTTHMLLPVSGLVQPGELLHE